MNKLFNLSFYRDNEEKLIKDIFESQNAIIFTPNIDHIIKISKDDTLFKQYSMADFIIADGWPLSFTGRLIGYRINRITGVDVMDRLLEKANKRNLNVFFLGAEEMTVNKLKRNIENKYLEIGNIGIHNGFFNDDEQVIKLINNNNTDILFVGMGCPKQEKWIMNNRDKIKCNIMIGIGGALKIYSEEVKRAPKYIQKLGLEWFYRFCKEPKRLFKRYFIEYLKFIPIFFNELRKKR
ncbi:WecB/TagA/CpsF family glycosyltransferase [Turicibacter sanguinis]|uniref:WecB/TagA/CpsF family glycosyltransferase n=1 Tax=Turicibacter sanguinis TaxID=154288 RepID=UPI0018A9679A|nr:WecB/TagA/CpsF family glycosyltransferase [Turicibacter sanguinis]MDB8567890.1 WecB/TagA/CpsF family glycosyltransferase [Turicibacter sanguinis]MDB8570639.1 WecB/TagA/CpsF family glycosyltransferase [Turicibacter sanguinis]MDB8573392.1 WecB/TagA/CpsF family glycosyltransferase [Turicibacter sanguinis]MDB8582152.1 WecB/TagA/CpsF family glycosyltransferase [Turicibacter sanguinis]